MINIPAHEPSTMYEYERLNVYICIQLNNNIKKNYDNNDCA